MYCLNDYAQTTTLARRENIPRGASKPHTQFFFPVGGGDRMHLLELDDVMITSIHTRAQVMKIKVCFPSKNKWN